MGELRGQRLIRKKMSEQDAERSPEEEERAPGKSPGGGRRITLGMNRGDRRLANYKLPPGLLEELARVAKKRGVTMTTIVEEALIEKLEATCESCGR